jgi:hypothetical protein
MPVAILPPVPHQEVLDAISQMEAVTALLQDQEDARSIPPDLLEPYALAFLRLRHAVNNP